MLDFDSLYEGHNFTTAKLPNGADILMSVRYTPRETLGVAALVAASALSCLAVVSLLSAISLSAFNTRTVPGKEHLFVRTHVAAYFVCLLSCDALQAAGSLMNIEWIIVRMVQMGTFCQIQGGIKQAADVGIAIWSLIIAVHTFNVLFLHLEIHRYVLYATLVGGWTTIGAIVLVGPANKITLQRGPFFGISGYWCWISSAYPTERITLDYMIMFLSAVLCFILYILIFLRMRGNIILRGRCLLLRLKPCPTSWRDDAPADNYTRSVARRMLLYPIAYAVLMLPIAVCRFISWSGRIVPFEATISSAVVYLLSGVMNVILFSTTRRILPPRSIFKLNISPPRLQQATTEIPPVPSIDRPDSIDKPGLSYFARTRSLSTALARSQRNDVVSSEILFLRRVETSTSDTSSPPSPTGYKVHSVPLPPDHSTNNAPYVPTDSSNTFGNALSLTYLPSSRDADTIPPSHYHGLHQPPLSRTASIGTTSIYSCADSFTHSDRDSLTEEYARLYRSDTVALNRCTNSPMHGSGSD